MSESCRTCLTNGRMLLPISSEVNDGLRVIDCFNECLKITILENDDLPQKICIPCLNTVLDVRKFYQKCIESEKTFKQQIKNNATSATIIFCKEDKLDDSQYVIDCNSEIIIPEQDETREINVSVLSNNKVENHNGYQVLGIENLEEEEQSDSEYGKFRCIECNEGFKYEKMYKLHMKIDHYFVQSMEKEFRNLSVPKVLKTIMDAHMQKCKICDVSFEFKKNFINHMRRHRLDQQKERKKSLHICPKSDCKKEFTTRVGLSSHMRRTHFWKGDNSSLCSECGLQMQSRKLYYRHMEIHRNMKTKRFECPTCKKLFNSNAHLQDHKRSHTGERPFKCKICEKSFNQVRSMRTHMTLHLEKTIPCTICDRKFTRNGLLRTHMRIHTNERPYACEYCPQRYIQKCHLTSHMLTHTDSRPYSCELCDMTFIKKEILRRHLYTHTAKPYKCPSCSLETASTFWFRKHVKRAHNIIVTDIQKYKQFDVLKSGNNKIICQEQVNDELKIPKLENEYVIKSSDDDNEEDDIFIN